MPARKKQAVYDPYMRVLVTQLVLCGLILAAGWAAEKQNPPYLAGLKGYYQGLLLGKQDLPSLGGLDLSYMELYDSARETLTGLLDRMTAERQLTQEAGLTGAGGWMEPAYGEGQLEPPTACALSPILVSAAVDPPISGPVTSLFGYRAHPLTGNADFHRGVDIAAPAGTPVRAALPGRVAEVGRSAVYGNYLVLEHGDGLQTTYCHCEWIAAAQGENLRRGELVATVGSTGISTGPHVHFELSKDGVYYNPAWMLDGMGGYGV